MLGNIYDMQTTVPRSVRLYGAHGDLVLTNQEREMVKFALAGLDGFYGGAGVHTEDTQRQLGHGAFPAKVVRTGRFMTLRGNFTFIDDRQRAIAARYLSSLSWDGGVGKLIADYDGLELSCSVRIDGQPLVEHEGANVLKLELPLFAPDPFLYAPARRFQVFPAGAGEGLVYPLFTNSRAPENLDWGAGVPLGGAAANQGNADAHPVYTVHGSWPAGFRITTGASVIEYPSPVHPSNPVRIDNRTGEVMVAGVDQTYRLTRRDWVTVPAGSAIQPRIEALAPSTGWCDVTIRDTYI